MKNFTKKDWLLSLLILVFILFQVWLDLKMPDYVSEITRLIQTEGTEIKSIIINGGYMLLAIEVFIILKLELCLLQVFINTKKE